MVQPPAGRSVNCHGGLFGDAGVPVSPRMKLVEPLEVPAATGTSKAPCTGWSLYETLPWNGNEVFWGTASGLPWPSTVCFWTTIVAAPGGGVT